MVSEDGEAAIAAAAAADAAADDEDLPAHAPRPTTGSPPLVEPGRPSEGGGLSLQRLKSMKSFKQAQSVYATHGPLGPPPAGVIKAGRRAGQLAGAKPAAEAGAVKAAKGGVKAHKVEGQWHVPAKTVR